MRETCLKPDKELIEEICSKYGENVRDAVTDAISSKNKDFLKVHRPVYDVKDYKKYHRSLIQLRPDVAMLIHLFERNTDDNWESIWLDDNDKYYEEDYECIKESAKQLLLQLEGHYCNLFIETLRDECNKILEDSEKNKKNIEKIK